MTTKFTRSRSRVQPTPKVCISKTAEQQIGRPPMGMRCSVLWELWAHASPAGTPILANFITGRTNEEQRFQYGFDDQTWLHWDMEIWAPESDPQPFISVDIEWYDTPSGYQQQFLELILPPISRPMEFSFHRLPLIDISTQTQAGLVDLRVGN